MAVGLAIAFAVHAALHSPATYAVGILAFSLAMLVASSLQVTNQWDKAVVLRMERFQALRGPGLFLTVPILGSSELRTKCKQHN